MLLMAIVSLVGFSAMAQGNDSIQSQPKFLYCEIVGSASLFSTKVKIDVDYGQEVSFWKQDRRMKSETGESIKFNSMVDALNHMGTEGWDFVQAYVVTVGNQNVYHWMLKRKIETK